MTSQYSITFLDNSGEKSTVGLHIADVTGANFDTLLDGPGSIPLALSVAIPALSLCNDVKHEVALAPWRAVEELPVDSYAQREMVLVVTMQDNVTFKKSTISIPGVNWDALGSIGSDLVNPLAVTWIAFVAAMEANALSPDGNAITVIGGRRAGRRN